MGVTTTRIESLRQLQELADSLREEKEATRTLCVCLGTGCCASGAEPLFEAFQEAVADRDATDRLEVKRTGCHGFCERGPVVVLRPEGTFYCSVSAEDAVEVVERVLAGEAKARSRGCSTSWTTAGCRRKRTCPSTSTSAGPLCVSTAS